MFAQLVVNHGISVRIKKMTNEERKLYEQWLEENGGKNGVLYQTFSDEELEYIFISAYAKNRK